MVNILWFVEYLAVGAVIAGIFARKVELDPYDSGDVCGAGWLALTWPVAVLLAAILALAYGIGRLCVGRRSR